MSIIVQAVLGICILIGVYFAVRGAVESPRTHIYARRLHEKFTRNVHGNGDEDEDKNVH
ncbi:Uncharacterised protein [Paenibacillus macerans]|uniref:Uncharacterized protein n=1 Tax=Paenibacillus macerans TaxID=44252 RepID=A0A090ZNP9_PAEMA|nr:hypothetical protein DJ90_1864 [Paenibacillus macerans]GBK60141.1 hypothetical protein PbDSM24746_01450 [Paenibacillus macerans]GBK66437.1 hypothetical protein PbJCM17693_01450 [Paenibacillus macerans]GIP09743.1 hypothetical protein J1TS5_19130 [Paenibacillus macerans]SUA84252.1 Uncharacterised protein [Paenibacillus macerans]